MHMPSTSAFHTFWRGWHCKARSQVNARVQYAARLQVLTTSGRAGWSVSSFSIKKEMMLSLVAPFARVYCGFRVSGGDSLDIADHLPAGRSGI